MEIKKIDHGFSVCKVADYSQVDLDKEYVFTGRTDEEKSLVCITDNVPANVTERDDGWKDFSLIGILSRIAGILAENEIGIFAVSTFNTDYILTKKENYDKALEALKQAGYEIIE